MIARNLRMMRNKPAVRRRKKIEPPPDEEVSVNVSGSSSIEERNVITRIQAFSRDKSPGVELS